VSRIVRFPRPVSPQVGAALIEEARAARARRLCDAVLMLADECRGWNADLAHTQQWRCLHAAANRVANAVQNPVELNEQERDRLFAALAELAAALSLLANELGVLALRCRK